MVSPMEPSALSVTMHTVSGYYFTPVVEVLVGASVCCVFASDCVGVVSHEHSNSEDATTSALARIAERLVSVWWIRGIGFSVK